ncbi:MAG TPA: hypothetical protein VMW36_01145 [Patescibacteria group bacterium]|nr:hypothetical protein [Patescibacteria group bacterium]
MNDQEQAAAEQAATDIRTFLDWLLESEIADSDGMPTLEMEDIVSNLSVYSDEVLGIKGRKTWNTEAEECNDNCLVHHKNCDGNCDHLLGHRNACIEYADQLDD